MGEATLTGLPTRHEVDSACHVAALIPEGRISTRDARDRYISSRDGRRFTVDDLVGGQELLMRVGVVAQVDGSDLVVSAGASILAALGDRIAMVALVALLLENEPPPWLVGAAGGPQLRAELIPDALRDELLAVAGGPEVLGALLFGAARRAEDRLPDDAGPAACDHVADECRRKLTSTGDASHDVRPLGPFARALGFDLDTPARRLAVRTALRVGWRVDVRLTRSEVEAGRADADWALVVCQHQEVGPPTILGWCPAAAINGMIPCDRHPHGRWTHVNLSLVPEALSPGLPSLA